MIKTTRHAAEGLFKRPDPAEGSDAAKLQDFRSRQVLRKRETKLAEMQQRLEKRATDTVGLTSFFR
ncbi:MULTISPECIES: hypothetical protein [Rhizobium/Agrobacterium group]|uniref:Transposase n=2 Tax=Neorhizobium TaxID=1525371 RepID=A0ABV0LVJ6_9HYPH|nr:MULTISPECIES: hypothetical protein [Rhizobium/Agrobacterium group]KGD86203.1 hypothetical protein JL39_29010 [Rhizobium sp. YS-1r]MCC2608617.1 hypothetical protein [Neorhizobium petrolearium]WGI68880.1 hypothetical protein QEO92_01945 [Neorhizobium petrolearium]